jgi:NAD(P)-dependent dehydrogenase (short-subunit alcohol dehydrogenase family)
LDGTVASGADHRVALVTGGNKGIGLAVVAGLARLGCRVQLGARDADRGGAAVAKLRAEGLDVDLTVIDVTSDGSVTQAADALSAKHGRLDVLVNNAAVKLELAPSPPSACSLDIVRETFETNVFGTIRVTQTMLPLLQRSDAARIVNVSSGLGSSTLATTPDSKYSKVPLLSYNPSKAALNSVTIQFANELRGTPSKVNAADPGYTNTDMTNRDARRGGARTPEQAAGVIVRLATLPAGGPTGTFHDEAGEVPW